MVMDVLASPDDEDLRVWLREQILTTHGLLSYAPPHDEPAEAVEADGTARVPDQEAALGHSDADEEEAEGEPPAPDERRPEEQPPVF
jgi:hypothetical protein